MGSRVSGMPTGPSNTMFFKNFDFNTSRNVSSLIPS